MKHSSQSPAAVPQNRDSFASFLLALGAYAVWGFLPLYMKNLSAMPPFEVVAHRVLWSLPLALGMVWLTGMGGALRAAFAQPRMIVMSAACSLLLTMNWGIYVWAIGQGYTVEAALGYFINPLFSVVMGRLFLNEKLNGAQWFSLALVAAAVVLLTVAAGRLPLVALGLTFTWGFYAFFKKSLPIGANEGFAVEVLLLVPFAAGYLLWLWWQGQSHFLSLGMPNTLLLMGTGLATAVPLILYANAAKGLRLSTIAMMQYLSPTLIFLCAIFIFHEPFSQVQAIAFPMIWLALVIYTVSMFRQRRQAVEA